MNTNTNTRRTFDTKALLAAVVVAASAAAPAAAQAGPVEDVQQSCVAAASGSADSLERWADHCRGASDEYREAYHACMRTAPGSADSLERWVEHCGAESAEIVAGT